MTGHARIYWTGASVGVFAGLVLTSIIGNAPITLAVLGCLTTVLAVRGD